jgi:hypothetical protein
LRRESASTSGARVREACVGVAALLFGFAVLQAGGRLLGTAAAAEDRPSPQAAAAPAAPTSFGPELPAAVVSYTIEARLDEATHRIDATQKLTFKNVATRALPELYFHLYLNAFKNEKSAFLRSPFGEGRGSARAEDWGYVDIERCTAPSFGPGDLWPAHTNGSPAEPDDETDVRLPLPRPLEPGESMTLELTFHAKLPAVLLRTGYAGDFEFVGQWFPKLAKLEPDGSFAHFPFRAQAEFYADFGDYDVTLDVPNAAVVGATGERVSSSVHGARRIDRYLAHGVHDFAWTAWPGFRELQSDVDGVHVRLLYPADQERGAALTLSTLRYALPSSS